MIVSRLALPLQTASLQNVCSSCARKLLLHQGGIARRSITSNVRRLTIARSTILDATFFQAKAPANTLQHTRAIAPEQCQSIPRRTTFSPSASTSEASTARAELDAQATRRRRKRLKQDGGDGDGDRPLPLDASTQLSQAASASPPRSLRRLAATYLSLSKPRLAILVVLTTTAAYSIYPVPELLSTSATTAPSLSTLTLAFLTSGTFLTIASANALNMLFEPQHDAKMSRTRNRPLVRGLLSKRAALLFAITTGLLGAGILWTGVNPTTSILGAGNLVLYAFVYTPLKRVHPLNTWVGAVVGAIPPLMGWCAAGSQYSAHNASAGDLSSILAEAEDLLFTEKAIGGWLLAALLFAWQFPHFFALSHAVRKEYAAAGYHMLTSTNVPMAARVSLRYSALMFPICAGLTYYDITDPAFVVTSTAINAWMTKEAWRFWRLNGEGGSARKLFWASVWQLPIVLVMAMVLKKGLWERIKQGVFGMSDLEQDEVD